MKKGMKSSAVSLENEEITILEGRGNIFSDLGFENADEMLAKAKLAVHIRNIIKSRKLTQAKAAELMGLDQPKVSSIVNGRLEGYSTERLIRFINDLGCDVKITVSKPHPGARGHLMFA